MSGDGFGITLTTSIAVSTITATAGYLLWSLRGGFLMATLVSSLPAWSHLDPLPVLESGPRQPGKAEQELAAVDKLFE